MSSRTVPRFAPAALLLAALAAPAGAQHRLPEAPMPRAKPANRFEVELKWTGGPAAPAHDFAALRQKMGAPLPIQFVPAAGPSRIRDYYRFGGGGISARCELWPADAPADAVFVFGPGGLTRVMPMPEPPRFLVPATPIPTGSFVIHEDGRVIVAGAALPPAKTFGGETVCAPCPLPVSVNPLSGTWHREIAGVGQVVATFIGDALTLKLTQRDGDVTVVMTVTAHCTVTRDGLVYGAITGGDMDLKAGKGDQLASELAELSAAMQELTDVPFSFRAKATSEGLMVSHLKLPMEGGGKKELIMFGGMYKRATDGKVPEFKPATTAKPNRCEECRPLVGTATGSAGSACEALIGRPVERVGIDFSAPTPVPAVPTSGVLPPAMAPPQPVGFAPPPYGDAMKAMAGDTFGEMLRDGGVFPRPLPYTKSVPCEARPACPTPQFPTLTPVGGMTLPSPRYLEHFPQYFPPDPSFPLPRELAAQELPAPTVAKPKPGHVGTWVREVGSKRCVLKVTPEHFTLTVSEAHEAEGGKAVTGHLTFTVDYHLTRDGQTAVGLVTGVDVKFDGDLPDEEGATMLQKTGELQRLLENNPLALSLRVYADALVVGNVRMQGANGLLETEPAAYLGGGYRSMTEKALSPLKPVKAGPKPQNDLPTLSGTPLPPPPPAAYGTPVGDLLPPQQLGRPQPLPTPTPTPSAPLPPIPLSGTTGALPAVQEAVGVAIPDVPPMTAPPPPAVRMMPPVPPLGPVSAEEPPVRTQRLWNSKDFENEDLYQIQNEWRRFWFPDAPSDTSARVMPMPQKPGEVRPVGIAIPTLGPLGLELDFTTPVRTPGDNRQLFNFGIGVFGSR